MGLPGLSINWGPWAEGGMAASLGSQHQNRLLRQGMSPITPERGFHLLADLLAQDSTQVGVLPINWSQFLGQLPVGTKMPLLEAFTSTVGQSGTGKSDFRQRLEATPVQERRELLRTHVHLQLSLVLGINNPDSISLETDFFDLGMDSLTSLEFKNNLQTSLGCSVPFNLAFDYPTVDKLVDYLAQQLNLKDSSLELINSQDSISNSVHKFTDNWIAYHKPIPNARLRLFCFHNAGGNASIFQKWSDSLSPDIEVCPIQLPGRAERIGEQPCTEFFSLIETLEKVLFHYLDKPFAFYSHSAGNLIGFELAHVLRQKYGLEPIHLFVGGFWAPHAAATGMEANFFTPSDEEMKKTFLEISEVPQNYIHTDEFVEKLLPTFNSDNQIFQSYTYFKKEPLNCSISAFGGIEDPLIGKEDLLEWHEQTRNIFKLHMLPGKHMFLNSSRKLLLETISQEILTSLNLIS